MDFLNLAFVCVKQGRRNNSWAPILLVAMCNTHSRPYHNQVYQRGVTFGKKRKVRTKLDHISQMNGLCVRFISLKYKSTVVFYKKDRDGYIKQLQFLGKPPNLCKIGLFSDLSGVCGSILA